LPFSLPFPYSTLFRSKASFISPVSGVSATSGPAARVAFSVESRAMVLPSGDQRGVARRPLALVSFLAGPPEALTTYNWSWPGFRSEEHTSELQSRVDL